MIPDIGGDPSLWWKLSTVITCGTLAGAIIPELVKVFTSTESQHVREVVTSSREGGASLKFFRDSSPAISAPTGWARDHGADGDRLRREHAGSRQL